MACAKAEQPTLTLIQGDSLPAECVKADLLSKMSCAFRVRAGLSGDYLPLATQEPARRLRVLF